MIAGLYFIKSKNSCIFGKQHFKACAAKKAVLISTKILYREGTVQIFKASFYFSVIQNKIMDPHRLDLRNDFTRRDCKDTGDSKAEISAQILRIECMDF